MQYKSIGIRFKTFVVETSWARIRKMLINLLTCFTNFADVQRYIKSIWLINGLNYDKHNICCSLKIMSLNINKITSLE